ncbi:MAG: phosphopantothenoylcysteine decarboxylase [Elusimicrobiota bacterium]
MVLKNLHVLITAGPTREYLDPVRYITNSSSGKMGIELANSFLKKGFNVTLVCGPTSLVLPKKSKNISVVSALEMFHVVQKKIKKVDVFVATAAVGDWRFEKISKIKMKKNKNRFLSIKLKKNPDILAFVGEQKKKGSNLLSVGFSLETHDVETFSRGKLINKNADLIVANTPESFSDKNIRPVFVYKKALSALDPHPDPLPFRERGKLLDSFLDFVEKKKHKSPLPLGEGQGEGKAVITFNKFPQISKKKCASLIVKWVENKIKND